TGKFGGIVYTDLTNVDALAGADTFKLDPGVTTFNGTLQGGDDSDTLAATDGANEWNITGHNSGTLNTTTLFVEIENLRGGTDVDHFDGSTAGSVDGMVEDLAGLTRLSGFIQTGGKQTYTGAVELLGHTTLNAALGSPAGADVTFGSTVESVADQAYNLSITN